MTMAGACVRYRRIRMFERIEMRSRALCWDDRFIYIEQSMWKTNGDCAGHIVYRGAFVGHDGIVSPESAFGLLWVKHRIDPTFQFGWLPGLRLRICAHGRPCRIEQFGSNFGLGPLNS